MFHRYLAFTFAATCALTTTVAASDERALASVAAADGFTYAWMPTESGVVLTRPGVRVVLRAGQRFYEVNNATPIADRAPTFNGDDLMISPELVARLDDIAHRTSSSRDANAAVEPALANVKRAAEMSRPITVAVHAVPGRQALALSGTATPNTLLAVALTGEISKDLPVVSIRRINVAVDANGTYATEVGYGPDVHQHMTITVAVSSSNSADRALAHLVIDSAPTGVTSSALDEWPKN